MIRTIAAGSLMLALLAACGTQVTDDQLECAGGAMTGGVLGGVIGNQFGSGSGNTAATVVGAGVGTAVGARAAC